MGRLAGKLGGSGNCLLVANIIIELAEGWGEKAGGSTSVVFAVVADHEHDLPFEDVVVYEPAGYSWKILCRLHVL